MRSAEILIAGAGPAGIAAAVRASECGKRVTILDDNPSAGGQIWRGGKAYAGNPEAASWFQKLETSGAELLDGTRILSGDVKRRTLQVETATGAFCVQYDDLIIATGARELFVPFPGWTLPNVMGVGGLQALVKNGLPVDGKRIVVAGSGPLLLAVAAYLRQHGAVVPLIAEQASWKRLVHFGAALFQHPAKLRQAIGLRASLATTPYLTSSWVESAEGDGKLVSVHIRNRLKSVPVDCDYLAVAYGLWPNTELAQHLGCLVQDCAVTVDSFQQTSLDRIYCAGEASGIGGVDLALVEGEIAGYAAAGRRDGASHLFPARGKAQRFANALNRAFVPREELRRLADAETIVCRCEDVRLGQLKSADSWRSAKLHLRCGMGPCQGRICGPAVRFLLGWKAESVRPPVFPSRVASLISETMPLKEGANK